MEIFDGSFARRAVAISAAVSWMVSSGIAQQSPAKAPLPGFGNTALDRKSGPGSGLSPFGRRVTTPAPVQPAPAAAPPNASPTAGAPGGGGLVLPEARTGLLDQGAGGQTMKMNDLKALLEQYGQPSNDRSAHPEVIVYDGPRMDGSGTARITYLMPLNEALAQLGGSLGMGSSLDAVAPGFPAGLQIKTYDIRLGAYSRLCLVVDRAKPQGQVVSLLLKSQNAGVLPPNDAVELMRDWHTTDYVNTVNRGIAGRKIRTWVADRRPKGYILVHTIMSDTTTWFAPAPLVNLCLDQLSRQLRH